MKKKSEISNKQWGTAIFNLKILLTVMRVSQVGKFLDAPQQVFVRFIVWDDNEGGGGGSGIFQYQWHARGGCISRNGRLT